MPHQSVADSIRRNVKAELERQHISQRALAHRMGLSQVQVWKRLNGTIEFRPSELEIAANLLGVEITSFLPQSSAA